MKTIFTKNDHNINDLTLNDYSLLLNKPPQEDENSYNESIWSALSITINTMIFYASLYSWALFFRQCNKCYWYI